MSPRTQTAATYVLSAVASAALTALILFVVMKDTGAMRGVFTEARAFCAAAAADGQLDPLSIAECVDTFGSLSEDSQQLLWGQLS